YGLFQLSIDLAPIYSNPYDYDDIAVRCVFNGPSGIRDTVDAFYMLDYSLDTTSGALVSKKTGAFRVRYSPRIPGHWSYALFYVSRSRVDVPKKDGKGAFECY